MFLPKRLTALQYDGWAKLEANLALPANEQLMKLTSSRAFAHVEKLYDEAEIKHRHGDEEQAYILFSRMCEIAKMITKKSDFNRFKATPDCRLLHDYFKKGLSVLDELQTSLKKRYELKHEVERTDSALSSAKTDGDNRTAADVDNDFGLVICPRDLVRKINSDKKVLFIDYRGDCLSVLKYEDPGKVFIARIPPSAIIPGCISSTLIHSAEISERVTLQRMSDVDIVVLVGPQTPVLENGTLKKGTVEHMLFEGLYTYNNNFRLRRAPVFLDGGFGNWALHYPMYVRTKSGIVESLFAGDGESKFLRNVAEYKQQIFDLRSVEYPDLLHRQKAASKTSSVTEINAVPSSLSITSNDKGVEAVGSTFSNVVSTGTVFNSAGHTISSSAPSVPHSKRDVDVKKPSNRKDVLETKKNIVLNHDVNSENAQNDVSSLKGVPSVLPGDRGVRQNLPSTLPSKPVVDRTTKPRIVIPEQKEVPKSNGVVKPSNDQKRPVSPSNVQLKARGGARAEVPIPPVPPVIPDRSKKPLLTSDTNDPLFGLYKLALSEIGEDAIKDRVTPGYTGLRNLRNTCYMNATLQALFNTLPLRNIYDSSAFLKFINRHNSKGTLGVCSAAFAALMSAVWNGSYSVINPSVFRNVFVREVNRDFGDYEQHDAQEFQIFLLAALHEDMDQVHSPVTFQQDYTGQNLQLEALEFEKKWRMYTNSPVNDIFRCVTLSVKRCKECGRESVSFEEITQLSVAISQASLSGCISAHFERVHLEGDSRWMCPKCNSYREATLKTDIWRPPQILVVHLKRSSDGINKNDSLVGFDIGPLDLKHCMHPLANFGGSSYRLYAVINHIGSLTSGHYTAYVQNVQKDGSKRWIVCDDDVIRPIDENSLCTKNAVVLYFQKC